MRWQGLVPRIEKDEAPLLRSLCLLHFLVIAAFTLARAARDGLLLSRLPADQLPYIFLGLAVGMLISSWGFDRLTAGARAHRALALALLITGGSLLLFLVWFNVHDSSAAIGFYLWTGAYGPLLVSEFWSLANERVNPRQARRLFGLIGASGILGGIASGGLTAWAGKWMPAQGLLATVAVLHFLGAYLARRSGTRQEEKAPRPVQTPAEQGLWESLSQPYVRILALIFLFGGLSTAILEYAFKFALQQRETDAGEITSVVGTFYGLQSLLALIAQVGLSGWILARFGTRIASMILPAGVLGGSVLILFSPSFFTVMGTRLFEATMRVSLARTAWEFLFFPLKDEQRRGIKRVVDGVVSRGSEAAGGLLILGLNGIFGGSLFQLAFLSIGIAVLWIGAELMLSRFYAKEVSTSLDRMLAQERPEPVTAAPDQAAATELLWLLRSAHEREVRYAMSLLHSIAPDALQEHSAELLAHPSEAVRSQANTLFSIQEAALGESALGLAAASSSLQSDSPQSSEPASSGQLAEAKPELLETFFDDRDAEVRQNAFRSAAFSGDRRYVPLLLERLGIPGDRKQAREALTGYGDRIVGTLGDYLIDPGVPLSLRRELPRVLSGIGTRDAAYELLRALHLQENRLILKSVLRALNQIHSHHTELHTTSPALSQHIRAELERHLQFILQRAAVQKMPEGQARKILLHVLAESIEHSLELLFRRLALLYPSREVLLAHRGLQSSNARLRAQSLEVLDTILEPEHKGLLLPLFDEEAGHEVLLAHAREQLHQQVPELSIALSQLTQSEDHWLKSCALFAIGSLRLTSLQAVIAESLDSSDPIVGETARWAKGQLNSEP